MIELKTSLEDETLALGRRLAGLLRPGDVVLLCGRLGCGKTRFVAGVADGLGVDEQVSSPTFIISREYQGFLPLVHADLYRLTSMSEFQDLELEREAQDGVLIVEWGDVVERAVKADHLLVHFEVVGENERLISFTPRGAWQQRPLQELAA